MRANSLRLVISALAIFSCNTWAGIDCQQRTCYKIIKLAALGSPSLVYLQSTDKATTVKPELLKYRLEPSAIDLKTIQIAWQGEEGVNFDAVALDPRNQITALEVTGTISHELYQAQKDPFYVTLMSWRYAPQESLGYHKP